MTRLARGFTSLPVMGALAALLIILLAVVVWLKPTPKPIPQREQTSIDSLAATQPHYDTVRLESIRVETLTVTKSLQSRAQASIARHVADSLQRIASELQRVATTSNEQSERWFTVAEVRRVENDSLRSANTALDSSLSQQTTARLSADARAIAVENRLRAQDDLSRRLANDIKRGDCRVLVVLRCPSRKAALAIGITGGAVAAYAWEHR